jgi:serine/threonine protein kinase
MADSASHREPLEELAESFLARFRAGERPSLTEFTAAHPELADQIRSLFPALVEMEQAGSLPEPATGPALPGADDGAMSESLGDYRIIREVGRGGMGVVYEAIQESLGRHVALKVFSPWLRSDARQIERFRREARAAARLHHTNIVPVFGVGEHEGQRYYAMQFIQGQGLHVILDELRRLRSAPEPEAGSGSSLRPGSTGSAPLAVTVAQSTLTGRFAEPAQRAAAPTPAEGDADDGVAGTLVGEVGVAGAPSPSARERRRLSRAATPPSPPLVRGGEASVDSQPRHPVLDRADFPPLAKGGHGGVSSPEREPCENHFKAADPPPSTDPSHWASQPGGSYARTVARVGFEVAEALAHAHGQGILHRDIKPSNLLLDVEGNTWVTDFGLAKSDDAEALTEPGDIVGTLRYMAPERFRGDSIPESDIYGLGVTLYELLTLRPAFEDGDRAHLIDHIQHTDPPPPRSVDPKVPRDLETIVLKAMAKHPADRYSSARALAEDLGRFLEDRTILARRSSTTERVWRWCRRNPVVAALLALAGTLTLAIAILSTAAAWVYRDQRNEIGHHLKHIQEAQTQRQLRLFESLVSQAQARRVSRRMGQRFEALDALAQAAAIARELKLPPARLDLLRDEAIACLALPDLKPTGRVIEKTPGTLASSFDSTMTRYALRLQDGTILVRRVEDDEELARFRDRGDREVRVFSLSLDGRYLTATHDPDHGLTVWDIDRRVIAVNAPGPGYWHGVFSPDSRRIAVEHEGNVLVYELATGQPVPTWGRPVGGGSPIFRPDGTEIAVAQGGEKGGTCRILDAETGRLLRSIQLPTVAATVAWSPDGTTLAIAGLDHKIYLWDAAIGSRRATLEGHVNEGFVGTFHPAGTLLASNGWEGRLWLWEPVLGRPWLNVTAFEAGAFSQDGRIVLDREDGLTTYQVDPALE